jgi:hypothetical protein
MEMKKQPKALWLASDAEHFAGWLERRSLPHKEMFSYAAELRRLHQVNVELVNVLRNILWHRKPGGHPSAYQREIEIMAGLAIDKATGEQQ